MPERVWEEILCEFFFQVADSFAFMNVLETIDLFPIGLTFFYDWQLRELGLAETNITDVVCRFELNENCQQNLLANEFARHERGMLPPRNYREYDADHFYYEYDQLYFFSGNRLIGRFIYHEDTWDFFNLTADEDKILKSLSQEVTSNLTRMQA